MLEELLPPLTWGETPGLDIQTAVAQLVDNAEGFYVGELSFFDWVNGRHTSSIIIAAVVCCAVYENRSKAL